MSLNSKMGQAHELFLVKILGGRKTKASGSQWTDQMDGRHARHQQEFAFAWDGKSTLAKSIGVTRKMWEKAREQAGGERPLLPLRFYDTEKLDVGLDLVVLSLDDFAEMLDRVNRPAEPIRIFTFNPGTEGGVIRVIMIRDGELSFQNSVVVTKSFMGGSVVIDGVETPGPVEVYVDNVLWHRQSS